MTTHRIARGAVGALVALSLLAACGGDDDSDTATTEADDTTTTVAETTTTEATVDPAAEAAAVEAVLTEFFSLVGQGELSAAAAMIENGEEAEPRLVHCEDLVSGVTIEMISVELVDETTATALFSILKDGAVLLAESGGGAVKLDGEWLVSENTFLSLYDAAKEGCTGTPPPE
ncbi:MAG: hypothetical protein ACSLFP_08605 [Acidimicrobiales bacterium]